MRSSVLLAIGFLTGALRAHQVHAQSHLSSQPRGIFSASSQPPIPFVFPATDPQDPPPVGSDVVPDFTDAWSSAYAKAGAKVCLFMVSLRSLSSLLLTCRAEKFLVMS